jgi:hypothetical protein
MINTELVLEEDTERLKLLAFSDEDNAKLFIECESKISISDGDTPHSSKEIFQILDKSFYADFFHSEVIEDIANILNKEKKSKRRRVAKGIPPKKGRDGRKVLLVKPYIATATSSSILDPLLEEESKVVDLRFVRSFDNIEVGDVVARIYPPREGEPGRDIYGKIIESSVGEAVSWKLDNSLTIKDEEESYKEIIANTYGYIVEKNGLLSISETLTISGDVDFSIGNIDFIGSVVVNGNVYKNFVVEAKKDITITGDVICASIISEEGNVSIQGYVSGYEDGAEPADAEVFEDDVFLPAEIKAKENINVKVLSGVYVECGKVLTIAKESRSCILRAGGIIQSENGAIFGGKCYSVCGIEAKFLGSKGESPTHVTLANSIEITSEYAQIVTHIKRHLRAIDLLTMHLGPHSDDVETLRKLTSEHGKRLRGVYQKRERLQSSLAELETKKTAMLSHAKENLYQRVNVAKLLYTGVALEAKDVVFNILENKTGPLTIEFNSEINNFEIVESRPLMCLVLDDE